MNLFYVRIFSERERAAFANLLPLSQIQMIEGCAVFCGASLDEAYEVAERFYRDAKEDSTFPKLRRQMRHRLGRNGHYWPEDNRPRITAQDLTAVNEAAKSVLAQ